MQLLSPRSLLVLGVMFGGLGLISYSSAVFRHARANGDAGVATTIRVLSRTIYASNGLVEFAQEHPLIKTHEEFVSLLRRNGLDQAWYAILCVEELSNGDRNDNLNYVRLSRMGGRFGMMMADLTALAGRPPDDPTSESATSRIVLIPKVFEGRDPDDFMGDLIERSKLR